MCYRVLLSLTMIGLCGNSLAEQTTRTLFTKFSEDLTGAWREYGMDKQKDAREKLILDVKDSFLKQITKAPIPPDLKMQQVVANLIAKLSESRSLFKLDKMKTARTSYETGCQQMYKREIAGASDINDSRTTQQVFELAIKWCEDARDSLRLSSSEAQTLAYTSINDAVVLIIKRAAVPEDVDHIAQLDKNLQDVRKRFPTSSPALSKSNLPILSILQARAKEIQQKSVKK